MWIFVFLVLSNACSNNDFKFNYTESGKASYYANLLNGRMTANGEIFSQDSLTAAHKFLPFGTKVLVKNLRNDREVIVIINDRGPFVRNRIIDLSRRAADSLDLLNHGVTKVEIKAFIENEDLAVELKAKTNQ